MLHKKVRWHKKAVVFLSTFKVFGGIFIITSGVDLLIVWSRFLYVWLLLSNFLASLLAAAVFGLWTAHHNERMCRADAYQADTYYQNMRVSGALMMIQHVTEECHHVMEGEHEQCRAAIRKELLVIKSALGRSPIPDIIAGALATDKISTAKLKCMECAHEIECKNFTPAGNDSASLQAARAMHEHVLAEHSQVHPA